MTLPVEVPVISTPIPVVNVGATELPEIKLPAAAVPPPIVLFDAEESSTPTRFATEYSPVASVPILLPTTWFPVAFVPSIRMPFRVLPEIRSPAWPVPVVPMTLLADWTSIPTRSGAAVRPSGSIPR